MARWVRVFAGIVVVVALGAQSAAAKDYAQTARNIIPSGQYGSAAAAARRRHAGARCTTG